MALKLGLRVRLDGLEREDMNGLTGTLIRVEQGIATIGVAGRELEVPLANVIAIPEPERLAGGEVEGGGEGQGAGADDEDDEGAWTDASGSEPEEGEGGASPSSGDGDAVDGFPPPVPEGPGRLCQHYKRGCFLIAACCGKRVPCRLCHDEEEGHTMDRHAVAEVVCANCDLRQSVAQRCAECDHLFGEYFCAVCNFFDHDGPSKQAFHCDGCGICRVGGRENFFHCHTCEGCYAVALRDKHTCLEAAMRSTCPVCLESTFDSRSAAQVLPCGHTMHGQCYTQYIRRSPIPACPTCKKLMVSKERIEPLWEAYRAEIAAVPMPPEYADKRVACYCPDCEVTSHGVQWHVVGLACGTCGGFNTMGADDAD